MEQSIRIGRIAGIEVGFNWSLLAVFWLIAWSLAAGRFPAHYEGYGSGAYWTAGIVTAVVFFACLLAHELGHALVAVRRGVEVDGITLWLFGGVARLRGEAMSPQAELAITAAGPAVSFALAGLFWLASAISQALGVADLGAGMLRWLAVINASLALFNLVPAFPLDGGRVLRAVLWRRSGDRLAATRTAARAGRGFAYLLIGLGLVEFAAGAGFGGLWFVFLGWFLMSAATAEESQALLRAALRDVRVADIMSPDPVVVPASASVEDFLENWALRNRFTTFPVADENGRITGLVTLARMKHLDPSGRTVTTVREVACPLDAVAVVSPRDPAVRVLEEMQECAEGRALVFDDGHLVGIVSPRDVQRALELAGLRRALAGVGREG